MAKNVAYNADVEKGINYRGLKCYLCGESTHLANLCGRTKDNGGSGLPAKSGPQAR